MLIVASMLIKMFVEIIVPPAPPFPYVCLSVKVDLASGAIEPIFSCELFATRVLLPAILEISPK